MEKKSATSTTTKERKTRDKSRTRDKSKTRDKSRSRRAKSKSRGGDASTASSQTLSPESVETSLKKKLKDEDSSVINKKGEERRGVYSVASVQSGDHDRSCSSDESSDIVNEEKKKGHSKREGKSSSSQSRIILPDDESLSSDATNNEKSSSKDKKKKKKDKKSSKRDKMKSTGSVISTGAKSTRSTRSDISRNSDRVKKSSNMSKSKKDDLNDSYQSNTPYGSVEDDPEYCVIIPDLEDQGEESEEEVVVRRSRTPSENRGGRERLTVSQTPKANRRATSAARQKFETPDMLLVPAFDHSSEDEMETTHQQPPINLLKHMQENYQQSLFRKSKQDCFDLTAGGDSAPVPKLSREPSSLATSDPIEGNPFLQEKNHTPYVVPPKKLELAIQEVEKVELTLSERLHAGEQLTAEEALMITVDKLRDRNSKMKEKQTYLLKRIGELQELVETRDTKARALRYFLRKQEEERIPEATGGGIMRYEGDSMDIAGSTHSMASFNHSSKGAATFQSAGAKMRHDSKRSDKW